MLSVASAAAFGLVAVGWLLKYGLGFAEDAGAAVRSIANLSPKAIAAAIGVARTIGCFSLWYSDNDADGPAIATALLSVAAVVEFSSIQQQGPLAATSSAAAILLSCNASYAGSVPQSIPLILILVSVCGLTL